MNNQYKTQRITAPPALSQEEMKEWVSPRPSLNHRQCWITMGVFLCLFFAGLAFGIWYDQQPTTEDILETEIVANYNQQIIANNLTGKCIEVQLLPDGANKYSGFARFSDNSSKPIAVLIDPKTGRFNVQ